MSESPGPTIALPTLRMAKSFHFSHSSRCVVTPHCGFTLRSLTHWVLCPGGQLLHSQPGPCHPVSSALLSTRAHRIDCVIFCGARLSGGVTAEEGRTVHLPRVCEPTQREEAGLYVNLKVITLDHGFISDRE